MVSETLAPAFRNELSSALNISNQPSSISSPYRLQQSLGSRALHQEQSDGLITEVSESISDIAGLGGLQLLAPEMNIGYVQYEKTLREIFQNIADGRLSEAGQSLLRVSGWLLGHVEDLGECSLVLLDSEADFFQLRSSYR
jgi:hypothetical protein